MHFVRLVHIAQMPVDQTGTRPDQSHEFEPPIRPGRFLKPVADADFPSGRDLGSLAEAPLHGSVIQHEGAASGARSVFPPKARCACWRRWPARKPNMTVLRASFGMPRLDRLTIFIGCPPVV
jgi:hypothetical protein